MNKRGGGVAYAFLLGIALALIVFSLFAFVSFDNKVKGNASYGKVLSEANFAETYSVEMLDFLISEVVREGRMGEFSNALKEIAEKNDLKYSGQGNLFAKIREGDFEFKQTSLGYSLEIKNVFVKVSVEGSEILRKFDLKAEFKGVSGEKIRAQKIYKGV